MEIGVVACRHPDAKRHRLANDASKSRVSLRNNAVYAGVIDNVKAVLSAIGRVGWTRSAGPGAHGLSTKHIDMRKKICSLRHLCAKCWSSEAADGYDFATPERGLAFSVDRAWCVCAGAQCAGWYRYAGLVVSTSVWTDASDTARAQ